MEKTTKRILLILVSLFNLSQLKLTQAKAAIVPGRDSNKYESGSYTLNDLAQVFVNVAQWILGIVGSLALLMFVYGGFLFLFSTGNTEKVNKGKQTILNATIGLFVVFLSYMIVGLVFKFTGATPDGTAWSKVGWFN